MYYPRSFLKFILLGFLLVCLPLVYALAELIFSLERLQAQGQEAVVQAAQAGRASRQLLEQTSTLERIVRQYLILRDSEANLIVDVLPDAAPPMNALSSRGRAASGAK